MGERGINNATVVREICMLFGSKNVEIFEFTEEEISERCSKAGRRRFFLKFSHA